MVNTASLIAFAGLLSLSSISAATPRHHRRLPLARRTYEQDSQTNLKGYCRPRKVIPISHPPESALGENATQHTFVPEPAQDVNPILNDDGKDAEKAVTAPAPTIVYTAPKPFETTPFSHCDPTAEERNEVPEKGEGITPEPLPAVSVSASASAALEVEVGVSSSRAVAHSTATVDVTSFVTVSEGTTEATISSSEASVPSGEATVSSSSIPPGQTSSSSSAASAVSSSSSAATLGNATSTASATVSSSAAQGATSTSSTAASAHPTVVPAHDCSAGSTYSVFTDDFTKFDESKWSLEAGLPNSTSFSKEGLKMELSKENQYIVFQSKTNWLPGTRMSVGIKSARAPGIVNALCFLKDAGISDEIDLELVEGSWQVPMWHRGSKLNFGQDVTGSLATSSKNLTSWVYADDDLVPFTKVHEWSVDWKADSLVWSGNGKELLKIEKTEKGRWVDQVLPVRFGPWAAGSWAGVVDWEKNPKPVMQIINMKVEGCKAN